MGPHHVSLTINEDGLVTSVGDENNNEFEKCIMCGSLTDVKVSTHIDYRYGYVEGAGQCCKECYEKTPNTKKEDDYISNVMKNRTTLITISAEDILNTPNDQQLGAKVRQAYWSIYGDKEAPIENQWVCSYCGRDTSEIEYDYLVNTDHLECVLKMNP
jgi:hypothetical protein